MWKITLYFSGGGSSWTEVYYVSSSASFTAAQTAGGQLSQTRAQMLAPPFFIQAVRVTSLANPRFSYFLTAGQFTSGPGFTYLPAANPDQDAAPSFTAVLVKLFGVANHISRRYFAGAPEGVIGTGPGVTRNLEALGLWGNALAGFQSTLGGAFLFRFNASVLAQVNTLVSSAQFPGLIGLSMTTQIVPPGTAKPQVYLQGFRSVNVKAFGLKGVYSIDPNSPGYLAGAVSPFVYYLRNTTQVTPANIQVIGRAGLLTYGYELYATSTSVNPPYTVVMATHRKRGVSALALRGRSRFKP